MELRRKLTNPKKQKSQSIESYVREIKYITDSVAAIKSPLMDQELIHYTVDGLDDDYETFITTATYFRVTLDLMIFVQN